MANSRLHVDPLASPASPAVVHHVSIFEEDENSHEEASETLDASTNGAGSSKARGRILLFIVSFLYGTLNVSFRLVYAQPDPPSASVLSTVRGWIATACFAPFLYPKLRHHRNDYEDQRGRTATDEEVPESHHHRRYLALVALELALLNFGAQALVNVGLLWIASARASFLTETSVVITPVVSRLAGHPVKITVWLSCAVAMTGLVILSDNDGRWGQFGSGDLLTLLGALCWSLYVFRLSSVSKYYDEVYLQSLKTALLALLYSTWFLVARMQSDGPLWAGSANL